MPRGVNKAIILGHIGQDPDIRHTNNSTVVCNLSVATNEEWKDKQSGEKRSRTEWHRVTAFGKLAEIMGEYLSKGQQVYIEGRLQTDKWQDTQGTDRWTTKIIASDMQMGRINSRASLPRRQILMMTFRSKCQHSWVSDCGGL